MPSAVSIAGVSTTLRVERWDAVQVAYVLRKTGAGDDPRVRATRSLTISPMTFYGLGVKPYSVTVHENCNQVVQAGWVALLGGIAGTTITTKFSSANGRIGIGTSTTATTYSMTQLVGDTGAASTTSYYQLVSASPVIATASTPPTLTFTATFGTGVANFAWNEFGTDNAAASSVTTTGTSSVFINRGVSPQGTKQSGQVWAATEILTFGVPTAAGAVS